MYFKQFYLGCLSQASYLIGSDGVAAVVDPRRDVDEYLEEAKKQNLEIRHVLETHFHADFVSGHRELTARAGARLYFGRQANPAYPVTKLADGDEVRVGKVILKTLETPGHTPESVCYLVVDTDKGEDPVAVLTGDTLFVGEVGRPDLMGTDLSAETMAAMLFDSLQKLLMLPDDVEVWPAHGPGSACGRNIGPETSSTIGKERRFNYALQFRDKAAFVEAVARNLPAPPRYFMVDARLNREGPGTLEQALSSLRPLSPAEVRRLGDAGRAVLLDTRPAAAFGRVHVPGAVQIGLDGRFASWAGTVLDPTTPLVLIAETGKEHESAMRLARVGYDNVRGFLDGGVDAWREAGLATGELAQIGVHELDRKVHAGSVRVVDVRAPVEWEDGHIEGAVPKPLPDLAQDPSGVPAGEKPVAVICGSGYRSSIAASLMLRAGFRGTLLNVTGGMAAWREAGLGTTKPEDAQVSG